MRTAQNIQLFFVLKIYPRLGVFFGVGKKFQTFTSNFFWISFQLNFTSRLKYQKIEHLTIFQKSHECLKWVVSSDFLPAKLYFWAQNVTTRWKRQKRCFKRGFRSGFRTQNVDLSAEDVETTQIIMICHIS